MTNRNSFCTSKSRGDLELSQKRYNYQQTKGKSYLVETFSKFLASFKIGEIVRTNIAIYIEIVFDSSGMHVHAVTKFIDRDQPKTTQGRNNIRNFQS